MTLVERIAKIQELAAQFTEAKDDLQCIDSLLGSIQREIWEAQTLIEEPTSRVAKLLFERECNGRMTTLYHMANFGSGGHGYQHIDHLRKLVRSGLLPVVRKNKKIYATPETLAAWYGLDRKAA